jgi:hypothetical protein
MHLERFPVGRFGFVEASEAQLALDPRRPAIVAALRLTSRDRGSGSGLTANRINQLNASGLYLAFNISSLFISTSALL